MKNSNQRSKEENLLDPDAQQHFHIPSAIRNRLHKFDSKNVYVALACELLARKGAHNRRVTLPSVYVRESYGKRVHEALIEMVDRNFVEREPYAAPNKQSLEWNVEKGYLTDEEANKINFLGRGKAFKYRIRKETLLKSKWVIYTAEKEDHHHHTWNAIFKQSKAEWEKSSNIQATEGLLIDLDGADRPHIKPLALANRRLTFSNIGDTLGRRYTTFGTMASNLRKFFRMNGERLVELDVTNSVFFHFFGALNKHREALTNDHGNWCPSRTELMAKKLTSPKRFSDQQNEKISEKEVTSLFLKASVMKRKIPGRLTKKLEKTEEQHSQHLSPSGVFDYYVGSKLSTHYEKKTYIDLDPVIEATSDEADHDFYEFMQGYMGETFDSSLETYDRPTRDQAKIQANTWANSENYFCYQDENGKTKKNQKRWDMADRILLDIHVGRWKPRHFGFRKLFGVLGGRTGCGMMREEARMMLGEVQPAVEREISAETLAVHDALYVPESKEEEAKQEMKATYRKEYGVAPQLK